MIHYEKLRPLIFQNQKSIEKYDIDYRGGINSALYDELIKVKGLRQEKPSNIGYDQLFLDIFNDVYYIITLVFMFKRPEHHIEDVYLVIAEKGNQSKNMLRTWAVMGMVLAILKHLNKCSSIHLLGGDIFIKRIVDAIQVWFDEGDEMKRNVAKKMCDAVFPVNMFIDKNVSFPIPLTSNFLKRINWGQYITLFDFNEELCYSYIGSSDVEELLLFLGRFIQEKYNVVLSLMEYVKNMREKDNREPVVINYESALADLEYYEQKWRPKKDSPTVEELTAPKQLVLFPELQYLYDEETPNEKAQSKQVDVKPNPVEKRSVEDELPSVEKMAGAYEKEVKEESHSFNKKKETPDFSSFVKDPNKVQAILEKLHRFIDGKKKSQISSLPIRAAMDAKQLLKPTWEAYRKEFPNCTNSRTCYERYTGARFDLTAYFRGKEFYLEMLDIFKSI